MQGRGQLSCSPSYLHMRISEYYSSSYSISPRPRRLEATSKRGGQGEPLAALRLLMSYFDFGFHGDVMSLSDEKKSAKMTELTRFWWEQKRI